MLDVTDEFTRECLAIRVDRKLNSVDVLDVLSDRFILRGVPGHVRSDNGPEFVAKAVRGWIAAVGAKTACIEPGSPWENGSVESFNARLRDELLDGEIFSSLAEARVVIESRRRPYDTSRPHRPWATGRQLPRWCYGQPHRQLGPWPQSRSCTNIPTGPPDGGRPFDENGIKFAFPNVQLVGGEPGPVAA